MIWHLDWVASAITLASMYAVGKRQWWGWLFSLVNCFVLTYINWSLKLWGFMPLNAILVVLFLKNAIDWYRHPPLSSTSE